MYDWLRDELQQSACIVTANRRLTRVLSEQHNQSQVAAGAGAWQSPAIYPWQSWLAHLVATSSGQQDLPARINAQQSQLIWERSLKKELGDATTGLSSLARLARDTWQRMADAQVTIKDVAAAARSEDQKLFAAGAGRYLSILEHNNWTDDAGLASLALRLVEESRVDMQDRYALTGFDSRKSSLEAIETALKKAGCTVVRIEAKPAISNVQICSFEHRDAELRAAGKWARAYADSSPGARIAVIAQGLERSATRDLRLVRDGFAPGWQHAGASLQDAVGVSMGRRLADYPAVHVALLVLQWLIADQRSLQVSRLLMSPLVGEEGLNGRSRLELKLRQMPDRAWSPSMISAVLRGDDGDGSDWLQRVAALSKRRRELPRTAAPSDWAILFDSVLTDIGWPGPAGRDSNEYQLIDRWKELLNEFARLELVSRSMSATTAIARLALIAQETVFQSETPHAAVHLMGPLEAAGGEFDAIWITGLTTRHWPPAGNPSPLLSRALQIRYQMPDATPADTLDYARKTLERLQSAASESVCSYPKVEDDVEQSPSDLLDTRAATATMDDPGWYAGSLLNHASAVRQKDSVPPIVDEIISGGAGTIQRQMSEPFAAFVFGRLGARQLQPQAIGIPAQVRGQIIHDSLYRLYTNRPDRNTILAWTDSQLDKQIATAIDGAFYRHERQVSEVLQQLFRIERERVARLLAEFVKLDASRDDFTVAELEGELQFQCNQVNLNLRFDRIDRYPDGGIAILDYKTGTSKELVLKNGDVREPQLFVYAYASDAPVAALALVNIDPRAISFRGAGREFGSDAEWSELLQTMSGQIEETCAELQSGDVRLIAEQGVGRSRTLNLLSRYTELRHGI